LVAVPGTRIVGRDHQYLLDTTGASQNSYSSVLGLY
jgi:hypothetical protein